MNRRLTIGVSTRALFDLEFEHKIFTEQGAMAYVNYQIENENQVLAPGAAFGLIKSFLDLNIPDHEPVTEVIIMSQNSSDSSLRIFNSIEYYGLDITRAALTTGMPISPYLEAFGVDLYLSQDEEDVRCALEAGVAAAVILSDSRSCAFSNHQIRIAFDGDCVLFSDEAQRIFDDEGLIAFGEHERDKAKVPLSPGPLANLLSSIATIQQMYPAEFSPIRTALVTARCAPAHERVIRTLRSWGIRIDEAFFLGGQDKSAILAAFGADIFFDDSETNTQSASRFVLAAKVPNIKRAG